MTELYLNKMLKLKNKTLISLILLIALTGTIASCSAPAPTYQMPAEADFSNLSWTQAFQQLNEKISREYAFTDWKDINWDSLFSRYSPDIEKAQSENDSKAYYVALREYLYSVPDGHVKLKGDDHGWKAQATGGGFGVVAMALDDGRIVAARVTEGSPAAMAGMKAGAELVQWDGKPAAEALADTLTLYANHPQATSEDVKYEKLRFLTRAPVGAARAVTFVNPDETTAKNVMLTAVDDGMDTLKFSDAFFDINQDIPSMVETKILPGNVGYVKVQAELDIPGQKPTIELFKEAMQSFSNAGVAGRVIDARKNFGGFDSMVVDFMSHFYQDKTFYEYINCFNEKTGKMEIWLANEKTGAFDKFGQGSYIEPGASVYKGPVVVLVNPGCVSSGEGIAMSIKNLPNGKVVGFWGTYGSFGLAGDTLHMPGDLNVEFPYGQSLNKDKIIQLDSRDMEGGVSPNVRVPMTLENALKWGAGEDVELGYALTTLGQMSAGK